MVFACRRYLRHAKKEVPLLTVETVEIATFVESIDYKTEYKESSSY